MENSENTIILGIDPGTTVLGYAVLKVEGKKPSLLTMGTLIFKECETHYDKLHKIFEHISVIIQDYQPTVLSIEAPFYGKNVQSMLKLGRAQGVAMAAALHNNMPVVEYSPLKIKMAITGNGSASKEQVCGMLYKMIRIDTIYEHLKLDATDALAAAFCHYLQIGKPKMEKSYSSWKDYALKNSDRIKK